MILLEKLKIVAIVAVIVIIIAGVAIIVSGNDSSKDSSGPFTVTDYLGRNVTINSTERIVSVSTTGTAILCGLGVSSNFVGVSSDASTYSVDSYAMSPTQDNFPQAVKDGMNSGKIKPLGAMYHLSAEAIVSVPSDLVVCDTLGTTPEIRNALDSLGVTYVVIASSNTVVEGIYEKIEFLGEVVGKQTEAKRIISEMKSTIKTICDWSESIVNNQLNGQKYNVALMMTADIAIGGNYPQGSVLKGLVVNNAFESVGTYASVSKESIASVNPDVLIYQTLGMGDGVTDPIGFVNSLYNDPVLKGINAAKKGLIFTTIEGAKTTAGNANQDFVNAYALYAMFIYKDFLTFSIPDVFDSDNYAGYLAQFWDMLNS